MSKTINELLAEWDTPEHRALVEQATAKYNAQPCKYSARECYVHGHLPARPCGHTCFGVNFKGRCPGCKPLTGRQRTRKRWRRQGRR